jgi:hypothetical protein
MGSALVALRFIFWEYLNFALSLLPKEIHICKVGRLSDVCILRMARSKVSLPLESEEENDHVENKID